jgi:uncharacterized membrane protein
MKLIGTLVGGLMGAAVGEWLGFFAGAAAGFVVALAVESRFSSARKELVDELAKVEAAFGKLHARISALEGEPPRQPAPPPVAASAETQAPAVAPQAAPSIPTPPPAAAPEPLIPARGAATREEMLRSMSRKAAAAQDAAIFDPVRIWRWLIGDNWMVRVGVVVLFFGVAFFIKEAAERVTVPIELRLAGVVLFAVALLIVGWRLRKRSGAYGLILQGAGVGILYLVIFGAFRIWGLLPAGLTMVLLIAVVALSAALAVLQNAPALAVAGAAGGFLAPILASTGGGNHVMLFSYYVVLNLGLLGVAWFKAWRVLNFIGFLFTFGIGAAWGANYYVPAYYASVQPFLVAFFLMYVAIATLFALRRAVELKDYVDSTLVFGTPIAAFGLQYALVKDFEYGAAWSAAIVGLFYLSLAAVLLRLRRTSLQRLLECFIALGVGFGTFAIPLAVDDRLTAAVWSLEGLGAIWMGIRQRRRLSLYFGVLLQFGAGYFFLVAPALEPRQAVLNSAFLGALMVGAAGVYAGRLLLKWRDEKDLHTPAALLLLLWGMAWLLAAGANEILRWLDDQAAANAMVAYAAGAFGLLGWLGERAQWRHARLGGFVLAPLLLYFIWAVFIEWRHPFDFYGWLVWPIALLVLYGLLRRNETLLPPQMLAACHCIALWLAVFITAWEFGGRIEDWVGGGRVWGLVAWPVVPALAALWLSRQRAGGSWPFSVHLRLYLLHGAGALLAFVYCWVWVANILSTGDPAPLPYLPLANPLDLTVMFAGLVGLAWWYALDRLAPPDAAETARFAKPPIAAAMFLWANAVLLRTLHHYAEVPFALNEMLRSTLVQTSLSIFWTLLALGAMLWAQRHVQRALWAAGGCLLAVVVVKLFFIDLSRLDGIERIVSFLGVGVLMLVIGYFVPVPPARKESA